MAETNIASLLNQASETGITPAEPPKSEDRVQIWTTDGYPIVDNKYRNLKTNELHLTGPDTIVKAGPPNLAIYWNNRARMDGSDRFGTLSTIAFVDITEYICRLGTFFRLGDCILDALMVTEYDVYVTVKTKLKEKEMLDRMRSAGVFPAPSNFDTT